MPLQVRPPGVYRFETHIEGNSILSSVFAKAIDAGATIDARWVDYTTGKEEGEEYELEAHRQLTDADALVTDRITVTRIHNKPHLEVTVAGGNAEFSVYFTVVSSFASDLDNALVFDQQIANLARDKGMPIAGYDEDGGTFNFIRAEDGRLLVKFDGDLSTLPVLIDKLVTGSSLGILPAATATVATYTVPVGNKFTWLGGRGTANGFSTFKVFIDGVRWLTRRSQYDDPDPELFPGNPMELSAGQVLRVDVDNRTFQNNNIDAEVFIYGREQTI
jgi:hypothetical protein